MKWAKTLLQQGKERHDRTVQGTIEAFETCYKYDMLRLIIGAMDEGSR